jgi:lipopolysaccharide/colanic/teichoic acid biosynthesis glycosyltransferase
MLKFRTMRAGMTGPEVTCSDDPRITAVGRLLRRTSLDELPQLWNILLGDMTLVGPRPETPRLSAAYPAELREVFRYRPGLTGPSQLAFRDAATIPSGEEAERYYLAVLVPMRCEEDLSYERNPTMRRTLAILFRTALHVLQFARGSRALRARALPQTPGRKVKAR